MSPRCLRIFAHLKRSTPLHEAIMSGQRKATKFLIQKGAEVSISNSNNMTAVQLALKHGYSSEEIVEYFGKYIS